MLVGIEGRTVVAGKPPLDLVEKVRRKDVRLFKDAHCGLGRVGLAVVEGDRSHVAARGCLTDGIRAGLAANGRNDSKRVLRADDVVETVRHGPVAEARGVGSNEVVLQSRADACFGQEGLHILCNRRELGRRDHIDSSAGQRRIACRACGGTRPVAVLIPAEAIGAVRGAEGLR